MASPQMTDAYAWKGRTMIGPDDKKIGNITDIYEDRDTGQPQWATVSSGMFGSKSNFVPLAGAAAADDDVRAQVTKDQVKDAPSIDDDEYLSEQEEARLFEHYGVPYTPEGSTTAQGVLDGGRVVSPGEGSDVSGPETPRSAQDGRAGTRQTDTGASRLRKYVVTEEGNSQR